MPKHIPLDSVVHAKYRVREGIDWTRIESQQVLPVVAHEVFMASSEYPLLFIKNAKTEKLQLVAVLGLEPGENLFFRDGTWTGIYRPRIIESDPFRLITIDLETEQLALTIDVESPLVSQTDGERLFGDDGKPTAMLEERRDRLTEYYQHQQLTEAFIEHLNSLELLHEQNLSLNIEGREISIGGTYVVDEVKLNSLPDEPLLDLHKRGMLPAIYALLVSLRQVPRLARMKAAQTMDS